MADFNSLQLGPLAARVMQGETVAIYDQLRPFLTCFGFVLQQQKLTLILCSHLPMIRDGFLEETYHAWCVTCSDPASLHSKELANPLSPAYRSYLPFRNVEGNVIGYQVRSPEPSSLAMRLV